jgi:CheY-like chemotaxis protein
MAQITNEAHLKSLRLIDRAARDSAEIVKRVPGFAKLDTGTSPAAEPLAIVDEQGPVRSEHGASVLVIDDDPLIRRTMADLLALDGHQATLAADGKEGISLFESGEYDVVFTDLAMPGMSGWDVAAATKAKRPHIPVVIVTGWGATLEQKDVESAGVDAVVLKPFRVKTVLGLVRSLVGEGAPAV